MSTHLDPTLTVEQRVDLLLPTMTLREKAFQLTSVPPWFFADSQGRRAEVATEYLTKAPGHICNFGVDDPATLASLVGTIQRTVVEGTRLGIPLLLHAEALNGFLAGGHVVFPTPTGLAATWSPELIEEMTDLIRRQMTRAGIRHALSPNMDIALDPRWGRVHETYGEDPYLVAALSVAFTRGLQTDDLRDGVIATAKHFIGYGLPEGGLNLSAYESGARRTRDLFAFPFEAAIQVAGLAAVMNSYSDIDGVPAAASREILTDLLRGELGFTGFVTSDYTTFEHMIDRQRVAPNAREAGILGIRAGLDTESPLPNAYGDTLADAVEAGDVEVSYLDESVRRVLSAKFALGLFENPYPQEHIDVAAVAVEGRDLSRELARRSVVLLENDGILPLTSKVPTIAIIGPHATAVELQFPTYSFPAFRAMTVAMSSGALGNMVGMDPAMVEWNEGVFDRLTAADYVRQRADATDLAEEVSANVGTLLVEPGTSITGDLDADSFARAVEAARHADIVILALGGASLWFDGDRTEGEASDTADIALPAAQARLADAVAATGTPYVSVVFQCRAYTLPASVRESAALVVAPYGGPYGPAAVADVLFGRVNPSGRLPYSIPRHGGQVPVYHHQPMGTGFRMGLPPGRDQHYLDMAATPLYTFGFGRSYSDFALDGLEFDTETTVDGQWRVSTDVGNVSGPAGVAVVQLYARMNALAVTRPAQQLVGFARVDLQPGERRRVTFTVDATQLAFSGLDRRVAVEPGDVDFFVGFDAADQRRGGRVTVSGARRPIQSAERTFFSEVTISGLEVNTA